MITLTTPPAINTVIGGNSPVNYDKLVIHEIHLDPVKETISAKVRLTSTTVATVSPVVGRLLVELATSSLTIQLEQLDIRQQIALSGPQVTSVRTIIRNAQNAIEAGLISLGTVAGTQSTGV